MSSKSVGVAALSSVRLVERLSVRLSTPAWMVLPPSMGAVGPVALGSYGGLLLMGVANAGFEGFIGLPRNSPSNWLPKTSLILVEPIFGM